MDRYLKPTVYFDFDHPLVSEFAQERGEGAVDEFDLAQRLYLAVRDEIPYNPYVFSFAPETFKASYALEVGKSYCIPKAGLLAAVARYWHIPSRIGLADVKNHIASEKLIAWLRSDVFAWHGYTELYLDNKWVIATPAFDKSLCEKVGVQPLEFDGREDSMFQEYTADGQKHMEYLRYHGDFDDVPVEKIIDGFRQQYPHLAQEFEDRLKSGGPTVEKSQTSRKLEDDF